MNDIIKGNNIDIRSIKKEDAAILLSWWNDGTIMKHVGFLKGLDITPSEVETLINEQILDTNQFRKSRIYIIVDNKSNKPIGEVSYSSLDLKNDSCAFGIKICDLSYQGKGFGKESVILFITYLFKKFNLHRVELETLVENVRAQILYEKVGFKSTGMKRDSWKDPFNNYRSAILMDVIKEEWFNLHRI